MLVLGVVLSSFTQLRIGPVGPSEILLFCLILITLILTKGNWVIHKNIYNIFWIIFLFTTVFFTLVFGIIESNLNFFHVREFLSYIFIFFFVLFLFNYYENQDYKKIEKILMYIYIVSSALIIPIYIYSLFSTNLLGYQLYFGERLRLLSDNPHQLSSYIGPIVILGLKYFSRNLFTFKNILLSINTIILTSIGISTLSTTFYIAIIISLIIVIVLNVRNYTRIFNNYKYLVSSISCAMLILILSILFFRLDLIYNIFLSDENGVGRIMLWISAVYLSLQNYFFGYGFGTVIPISSNIIATSEAHNLLLDILLKGGILPAVLLFILFIYTLYKFLPYKLYTAIFIFICIYSFAGFTLKRIIFWYLIVTIFVIISKRRREKFNEKNIDYR